MKKKNGSLIVFGYCVQILHHEVNFFTKFVSFPTQPNFALEIILKNHVTYTSNPMLFSHFATSSFCHDKTLFFAPCIGNGVDNINSDCSGTRQQELLSFYVSLLQVNRPFPNYLWPLFQVESWCSSFHVKISFHLHVNEN